MAGPVRARWLQIGALALSGLILGCRSERSLASETSADLVTIAPDVSDDCRDVGGAVDGARVCWSFDCPNGSCRVERTLPAFAAGSPMGWRCVGAGQERRCTDRKDDASPFSCDKGRCTQQHPRVPDTSEWSCADAAGAALCLERAPAAGVVRAKVDPGFVCGQRSIPGKAPAERVCLDLDPDFPDGRAAGWNCHYEAEPRLARVCLARPTAAVGGACSPPLGCPPGTSCANDVCVPRAAPPTCWLDVDCKTGHCRLGSCVSDL